MSRSSAPKATPALHVVGQTAIAIDRDFFLQALQKALQHNLQGILLSTTKRVWQLKDGIRLEFPPVPIENFHLLFTAIGPGWEAKFDIFEPGRVAVRVNGNGPLGHSTFGRLRQSWPADKYPDVRRLTLKMFGIPGED
ncbi:MAG TPA: hypothetical protein VHP58_01140 [Alphaproteobacteria bacterium]|nr:hypothetical protein [Alphaproteobacteria bacterium]